MVFYGALKYIVLERTRLAIGLGSELKFTRFAFDPRQLFV